MKILLIARICHFCFLTSFVNTYVLFAGNLGSFRNIARKYVPAMLADQIANIAEKASMKSRDDEDVKFEAIIDRGQKDFPIYNEDEPQKTRILVQHQEAISIDEIVDKVKEKLEKDFHNKYVTNLTVLQTILNRNRNQKHDYEEHNIDYSQDYNPKELPRPKIDAKYVRYTKSKPTPVEFGETTPDTRTFNKIKIGNVRDSYEDYIIPEKDDSSIPRPINLKSNPAEKINEQSDYDIMKFEPNKERNRELDYEFDKTNSQLNRETKQERVFGNVKVQTENLFYEDLASDNTKRPVLQTMIPTKKFFRFSSPNYYAKLPKRVERYDFNEPLPEKDREKENLRYIENPPARINGKPALKV